MGREAERCKKDDQKIYDPTLARAWDRTQRLSWARSASWAGQGRGGYATLSEDRQQVEGANPSHYRLQCRPLVIYFLDTSALPRTLKNGGLSREVTASAIVQKLWKYCNVRRDDAMTYGGYPSADSGLALSS